jgi:hypothetical protein
MEHLDLDQLRTELEAYIGADMNERFEVRRERPDSGITGFLVRKEWLGVSAYERQRQLLQFLEGRFGSAADDVSLILTFTPEEYAEWSEDQLAPM